MKRIDKMVPNFSTKGTMKQHMSSAFTIRPVENTNMWRKGHIWTPLLKEVRSVHLT